MIGLPFLIDRESFRRCGGMWVALCLATLSEGAESTNISDRISTNRPSIQVSTNTSKGGAIRVDPPRSAVDEFSYEAFKIINDRNIFSPTRTRSTGREESRERPRTPKVDTMALVGTMSYFKGTFAFFDGSSGDYRKSTQVGDTVAGFKVAAINPEGATVVSGTNTYKLKVGSRLRREEAGEWAIADPSVGFETASAKSGSSDKSDGGASDSGGGESDVLKRLLEKREKELKNEK